MAHNLALPLSLASAGFAGSTSASRTRTVSRGGAWSGRHGQEGTPQSTTAASSSAVCGRDALGRGRRRRTRAGVELGVVRAAVDADGSSTSGEEVSASRSASASTSPRPDAPGDNARLRPAASTFTQRVEAAAAALRSGTAGQQRRKPQTTTFDPSASVDGDRSPEPASPSFASAPSRLESRASPSASVPRPSVGAPAPATASSLLNTSENTDQMAASQNRLFEQMVTLRTRLNERLAASNKFAKFLEATISTRDKDIKHANERLVAAMLEIESLRNIAKDAVDAAADPVQTREHVAARLATLTQRLDLMHGALRRDVKHIDAACIKSVPIRWVGMAADIRIMGSFDRWTKGIAMSPEFIEGGNNVFVADLMLISGTYEIKFVVDGIWQTAPDWATSGDGLDANNLLVVE